MKLADVKVDGEVGYRPYSYWGADPVHCKVLELIDIGDGRPREVELQVLERGGPEGNYPPDYVFQVSARYLEPWSQVAERIATRVDREQIQNTLRERLDKALGILGLHSERATNIRSYDDNAGNLDDVLAHISTATVSIFELEKLAAAVIEIERLVYNWCYGMGDARQELEAIRQWVANHDFSNVTGQS